MLYVFHGTNNTRVADQSSKLVAGLLKKKTDAQVYYFDEEEIRESDIDALVEAQGLFVQRHIVVLKQPLQNSQTKEIIFERLVQFKDSNNIFILVEGKLLAPEKKKLEKHAEKIEEHNSTEAKKETYNVFALGDALGRKDKKTLWAGYIEALKSGIEVESLHGTLHWALKAMIASSTSESAEASGEKQFSYNKFRKYAQNFKEGELTNHSRKLIEIYHDARRGKHELDIALERWILSI